MYLRIVFIVLIAYAMAGCSTTTLVSRQLERVAKDWCLGIRASQVIPVYPLTEDIQPGDVFLVQIPLERQIEVYKTKGFLPLENLVVRLQPENYYSFYSGGYGIDQTKLPPRLWQFSQTNTGMPDYSSAPRSAFPTYGFSVSRGEGLNVSVPVNAIPIGLNLLDSAEAHGTITITDSFTYGTDMYELWEQVRGWAAQDNKRDFLKQFAPYYEKETPEDDMGNLKFNYLRVVTRVYLTGKVKVVLFSDEVTSGGVAAGVPRPIDLLSLSASSEASGNLDKVNEIINKLMQAGNGRVASAGGTVKIAIASSKSVSIDEEFARPLVIGYIGFDIPVLEDGMLGSPVSTGLQLAGGDVVKPTGFGKDENSTKIIFWLKQEKENRRKLGDYLDKRGISRDLIPNVIFGAQYRTTRKQIIEHFNIR